MEEEDEYSPSEFDYPEDLGTSNIEKLKQTLEDWGSSQEAIDDFINKQKVQNDRNNLFRVWQMKELKPYLRKSLTTFCPSFFLWTHK